MNSTQHEGMGLTRFVIVGNGLEAWLAANHLLASFGGRRIEVTVCSVPGSNTFDELYSIWPINADDGLGPVKLTAGALIRDCRGSFSLGAQYTEMFRPYGSIGLDFLGTAFHHHWLRAFADEPVSGYFDWSPATVALKQGRFAPPVPQNAIGSLQHGIALHVDTGLFTKLLRDRALRNGALESNGTLSGVRREGDDKRITGLETSDGGSLTADLYVDCSGPQRSLVSGSHDAGWQPAPGLADYRVTCTKDTTQEQPPSCHHVKPGPDGWQLDVPGHGWKTQILIDGSSTATDGESVSPGYFNKPWTGNCVALGMASFSLPPIEPVHTRYLVTSLKRLVDLMPGTNCDPRETVEYNNMAKTDLVEIVDLIAAHEIFRKQVAGSAPGHIHSSLKKRLDLFTHRGWVAPPDSGFFETKDWVAAFMQLGVVPQRYDRLAERIPRDTLDKHLHNLSARIAETVKEFPPLKQFLDAANAAARK